MDAFISNEVEPILPDGWDGESDLFAEVGNDVDAFLADGSKELTEFPPENDESNSVADDPTTVEQVGEENLSDETETQTETPDGEKQTETRSRKLKLKVNHREEEIDVDALSDDELIAMLRKGRAFDAMKETENKQRYRDIYNAQIEAGMTEGAARLVAQSEVGKTYALTDEAETPAVTATPEVKTAEPVRDFQAEVAQLKDLYPDFKEMPDEVARNVAKGIPLLNAYLAYREKQSAKTAASLKKENEVLKQNAASAAKAPVKGVSGGGVAPKKVDPFLVGFDSDY
jgi:hypothetical protein